MRKPLRELPLEEQREELVRHVRTIFNAYERSCRDPKACIPSYLLAALVAAAEAVG